jgi:UDP-N-acetylmuramoyl-L-alanyl-D-glutamate--2,6-diaminopimelate ligase
VAVRLPALLARLPGAVAHGRGHDTVMLRDATHDTRSVGPGTLFCAVIGARHDGHDLAEEAVAAGATALLVERPLGVDVPQVLVPSVRAAMGPAAALVHGDPAGELRVVGVTGTNGKTTVTTMLEQAFGRAGLGTGVIGTLGARIHGMSVGGDRTTPEATDLQRLLRAMVDRGVAALAMEVSSHGLDLRRVDGMRFDVAAFTNLGRDHLDWHGDLERYLAAKARLFTPELADQGVVLLDAPGAPELLRLARIPMTTIGVRGADVTVRDRRIARDGSHALLVLDGEEIPVRTGMRGGFNLDNALVAVVAAVRAGVAPDVAAAGVSAATAPPGRLEPVLPDRSPGDVDVSGARERLPLVLVDYAHTPDAVTLVVDVGRALAGDARLIVLLGAGGDRDRDKRPGMGAAAAAADLVVVTDDNPRGEDPASIRAAVLTGARSGSAVVEEVADRGAAVRRAVGAARAEDVVLVLGRGHETHQEVAGQLLPLDDRALVRAALADRLTVTP